MAEDEENRLRIFRCKRDGLRIELMAAEVAQRMGVSYESLLRRFKRSVSASARMVLCFCAQQVGFTTRQIGDYLDISQTAVINASRRSGRIVRKERITLS